MDFKSSYTLVPPPTSLNRPLKAIFLLILSTFAVFLFSCKGGLFASPDDGIVIRTYDADSWRDGGNRYSGRGRSVFRTPDDSGTENYTYEISLTREKRVYKKTVASGTVVVIENIPVGPWTITCRAYKSDGSLEYMGSVDVEIVADETTAATVELKKWTAGNTTITFKANGGTGDDCTQTVTCGTTVNLNGNTFTREGYAFKGWNTKADGSGTYYPNKTSFTATDSNELTLYAQWHSFTGKVYLGANTNHNFEGYGSFIYFPDETTAILVSATKPGESIQYEKNSEKSFFPNSATIVLDESTNTAIFMPDKIIMINSSQKATKQSDEPGFPGTWTVGSCTTCTYKEDGTAVVAGLVGGSYTIDDNGFVVNISEYQHDYGYFDGTDFYYNVAILKEVTDSEIINNVINAVQNP